MSDLVGNLKDKFSCVAAHLLTHTSFTLTTVKPVLSEHIKQDIFWAFQTGGCLLLHESSAESSHGLSALLSFSNKQPPV